MHEKEFPIELPISNQIILMQGAVAGLKRVKNKTKKTPKTPKQPWISTHRLCGKIL